MTSLKVITKYSLCFLTIYFVTQNQIFKQMSLLVHSNEKKLISFLHSCLQKIIYLPAAAEFMTIMSIPANFTGPTKSKLVLTFAFQFDMSHKDCL